MLQICHTHIVPMGRNGRSESDNAEN